MPVVLEHLNPSHSIRRDANCKFGSFQMWRVLSCMKVKQDDDEKQHRHFQRGFPEYVKVKKNN